MNYEDFKEAVLGEVTGRVQGCRIVIKRVDKNNGVSKDGLVIYRDGEGISPTLYLESYYSDYAGGKDFGAVVDNLMKDYEDAGGIYMPAGFDYRSMLQFKQVRDRIVYRIINKRMNEELLRDIPYRSFAGDLAITFLVLLETGDGSNATMVINNRIMEEWDTDVEELIELAVENTPRLMGWELASMQDVLAGQGLPCGEDGDFGLQPMYVLTNKQKMYGASCVLYPGVLEDVSEKLNGDFYILPSSLHEVIIIPAYLSASIKELTEMICEVNETQVPAEQVLSDHPYRYVRDKGMVAA